MIRTTLVAAALIGLLSAASAAEKVRLPAFKDELFAYPKVLAETEDHSRARIEFIRGRDVIGRDAVPEKKAKPDRVDLGVNGKMQDLILTEGAVKVPFVELGDIRKKHKFAFVFIHGANGNRHQGVDDNMFGGNFNRLKNLVAKAGGIYLSPGMRDQRSAGVAAAKLVILEFAKASPGAPVIIACSSNGGRVCQSLLADAAVAPHLGGAVFLGASSSTSFKLAAAKPVPVLLAHGSGDKIINWRRSERLYNTLRSRYPGYPVRLLVFEGGAHGTPMRMIDWRAELNRLLELGGR